MADRFSEAFGNLAWYNGHEEWLWKLADRLAESDAGTCPNCVPPDEWNTDKHALWMMLVSAFGDWGLTFDAVNENLPERIEMFGNDPRKIGADEYWDDRAVALSDIPGIAFSERFRNKLLYGVACTDAELEVMTHENP